MVGSGNILEPLYNMWHSQGCDIITRGGLLTYFHYDVLGAVTIFTPRVIVYIVSLMRFAHGSKMITILIHYGPFIGNNLYLWLTKYEDWVIVVLY